MSRHIKSQAPARHGLVPSDLEPPPSLPRTSPTPHLPAFAPASPLPADHQLPRQDLLQGLFLCEGTLLSPHGALQSLALPDGVGFPCLSLAC